MVEKRKVAHSTQFRPTPKIKSQLGPAVVVEEVEKVKVRLQITTEHSQPREKLGSKSKNKEKSSWMYERENYMCKPMNVQK